MKKLCKHCDKRPATHGPNKTLCEVCVKFPVCKSCECIMGVRLAKQSKNPKYCTVCYEKLRNKN
jgi:hypothetical protein